MHILQILPPISVKSGIFQGDSLSVLRFCIARNPLSSLLNKTNYGYKIVGIQPPLYMKLGTRKCKINSFIKGRHAKYQNCILQDINIREMKHTNTVVIYKKQAPIKQIQKNN